MRQEPVFLFGEGDAESRSREPEDGAKPARRDPVRIERIQQVAEGDLDFERELIDTFLADLAPRLADLERCVRQQDAAGLRFEAHALKGSSGNAGAGGLQELAHQLETAGARGEMEATPEVLERLRLECEQVSSWLQAYLENLGASRDHTSIPPSG